MHLPYLRSRKQKTEKQIVAFRGVNYGEAVRDGDLSESQNLTAERFPCMSPRGGRTAEGDYDSATAVYHFRGMRFVVDGNKLTADGAEISTVSPGKKQFATVNSKLVVFPDKIQYDTETRELRGLEAVYTAQQDSVRFESNDKESRLITHIGTYVESVFESGNIGGSNALGKNNPIFCDDAAPFSRVYESGGVDTDTGKLVFGSELSGVLAQDLQVGNAFVATDLNADGQKRFGRITGKTKFLAEGLSAENTYYAWDKYDLVPGNTTKSTWTPTGNTYEAGCFNGFAHPVIEGFSYGDANATLYLWTKSQSGTMELAFGTGLTRDQDGYWAFENESRVTYAFAYDDSSATVWIEPVRFNSGQITNRYAVLYIGFVENGHITTYLQMNVRPQDSNDIGTERIKATLRTTKRDDHFAVYVSYNIALDPYGSATLGHSDGQAYLKGTEKGKVFSLSSNDYPQDGIASDNFWYTYRKEYRNPAYYGFDYQLIGAGDGGGEHGFQKANFRKGDTVEISGCETVAKNNISATIRDIKEEVADGVTWHVLVFDGNLFSAGTEAGAVAIKRKVPNLTVICESNNRLWGAEGSTIFASALGDPTNFYTYDGLDTDSYAVAVASEGAFTGCCGFGNSVLFWKEDKLHKILGAYPSQYTMYEYNVPGVKLGSEQSLCNINEVVYYHGREGVYRYNGGSPELISENFGLRRYEEAAAGAIEGRYYLSMKDRQKGEWGLWVYDTLKNIWLREDDTHAMGFSANEGKLYCIGGSKLMCLNPDHPGEVFAWSATTARMDEMFHNRKCYSKLLLRAELLEDSAWLQVDISCDGEPFKRVYTSRDKAAKTLAIPIMPKRCDNFRIRLSGEGKFIIRSLVREFGIGSEY